MRQTWSTKYLLISPHCPGASRVVMAISGAMQSLNYSWVDWVGSMQSIAKCFHTSSFHQFLLDLLAHHLCHLSMICLALLNTAMGPRRDAFCNTGSNHMAMLGVHVQGAAILQPEIDGECTLSPRPKGWLLLQQHLDDGFSCGLAAKAWRTSIERACWLWAAQVEYEHHWFSLFSCQSASLSMICALVKWCNMMQQFKIYFKMM